MNGFVLKVLRSEFLERYDRSAWTAVHEAADVEPKLYIPSSEYEDELVDSLVDATVETTEWDRAELLADIGRTLGPELLPVIRVDIDSDWSALGVVERLDRIFERTYERKGFSRDEPPALDCQAAGEGRVSVEMRSHKAYCSLFAGIIEAIGEEYDQPLAVTHLGCGASADGSDCTLLVSPTRRGEGMASGTGRDSEFEFEHSGA